MIALLRALSKEEHGRLKLESVPTEPKPMLATVAPEPFSDPDWVFERKLDGERVLAVFDGRRLRLSSRNGKDVTDSYPEIPDALREAWSAGSVDGPGSRGRPVPPFVIDGEIVAFEDSITSFSRLQERIRIHDAREARESDVGIYYYAFDLLHLGGYALANLPLRTRKRLLSEAIAFSGPVRFTPHRNGDGEAFHHEACRKGWEGIMAKRASSPYRPSRSSDWLKLKCANRQELVIGGFTEPRGNRRGFGALLVGYFEDGELRYAGKVGTGFDEPTLRRLSRRLRAKERKTPPFSAGDARSLPKQDAHWVTPALVGRFGFTEWTGSGKLRHPRFLGLRRDKDPREVERERPRG